MIQLFFFVSMISIAALLINLLWYLDDSYEVEHKFVIEQNRKKRVSNNMASSSAINRMNNDSKSYKHIENRVKKSNSNHIITNSNRMLSFYDVGTPYENLNESLSNNQSVCA